MAKKIASVLAIPMIMTEASIDIIFAIVLSFEALVLDQSILPLK